MQGYKEKIIEKCILLVAFSTVFVLFLITFFIAKEGLPFIFKYNFINFISQVQWLPAEGKFSILPMILGSFWVTFGALIVGVPLGVACAIFIVEFSHKKLDRKSVCRERV